MVLNLRRWHARRGATASITHPTTNDFAKSVLTKTEPGEKSKRTALAKICLRSLIVAMVRGAKVFTLDGQLKIRRNSTASNRAVATTALHRAAAFDGALKNQIRFFLARSLINTERA